MLDYHEFLQKKSQLGGFYGFDPVFMPTFLFDFQQALVDWSLRKGRAAIFADCGLGKTPIQLVWAENVTRKSGGRVLIVTPLAVSHQTEREGQKFGIEVKRSVDGAPSGAITVTNYERLHLFSANDYQGVVCDESSILKNFNGARRAIITEFLRTRPYRLLCTATAAPNDYIELGTTSEALGEMGFMDMLGRFFKNDQNTSGTKGKYLANGDYAPKWRFKRHAQGVFWRWVSSWARALRRPSDMGFTDEGFELPPLKESLVVVGESKPKPGEMFARPARGIKEQLSELRTTLHGRCEKAAELVNNNSVAVVWCHLNQEGDLLEKLIPDSIQVAGSDSEHRKEEGLRAFCERNVRVLITKPKVAGFGLNWQHCSHMTVFPSHSFEQYYQSVRRCWRFGQTSPVIVDLISTPGGSATLKNLQRKAAAADKMFSELVSHMNDSIKVDPIRTFSNQMESPPWL